jgi:dihydropteroate synthase
LNLMANLVYPAVMGILNASPDSFANAGAADTIAAGLDMIAHGAAILDIGGESTRPGAPIVSPTEEQSRILPLIDALAGRGVPISVDTRNAATMRAALAAGASIVNDVSGLTHDPNAATTIARAGCRVVLMHMRGTPQTMTRLTHYTDLVADILSELTARLQAAEQAGIARENIIIDPGIGFAKTASQNLELLRRLGEFAALRMPLLVGASRKSFIGTFGRQPDPSRRAPGSIAAALFALDRGASILRVHDVAETVQAMRIWAALKS